MAASSDSHVLSLTIAHLGCASCAARMESQIRQLPGIRRATLDFSTARLHLVLAEDAQPQQMLPVIDGIIHSIESDACLLSARPPALRWYRSLPWRRLIRLAGGLLPFTAAWLLPAGHMLRLPLFLAAYLILGYDVLLAAFGHIGHKQLFDEHFLMSVATLGALAIGEYPEAVAVMLFYQIGDICQQLAVDHSRRSIQALIDIRPDQANLITPEGLQVTAAARVQTGDRLLIRPGERIPLDSRIIEGNSSLDMAALTGESLPRLVEPGDEILAGCVNGSGLLTVEVIRPFGESAISRIMAMVEEASARKAAVEQFINRFAAIYTPLMVGLAVLVAVLPPLILHQPLAFWLARALILLVISCPCALVLSVPLGYFGGLGAASSRGILVKGGIFLEKLAKVSAIAFDKTGTITQGRLTVSRIISGAMPTDEVLRLATLAESYSSHPIALSIMEAWQSAGHDLPDQTLISQYRDVAGRGVTIDLAGRHILLGNDRLMKDYQVNLPGIEAGPAAAEAVAAEGTILYLAVDGQYAGEIWLDDKLKPEAPAVVRQLQAAGLQLYLLSGDRWPVARRTAAEAGISEVSAELLPEQKVAALEAIITSRDNHGMTVYVGDGINDAPVLARADVGIALGTGSDAAIESADIVIMADDLGQIVEAISVARRTSRIIRQNVGLALGLKALVLILAVLGAAGIWQAVFADVGVAVIAVFNSLRVLSRRQKRAG